MQPTPAAAGAARIEPGRPDSSIREAEEAGLVFAFRARCLAILVVAVSIVVVVPWPRNLYYLGFVAGFFAARLRAVPAATAPRMPRAIKLSFVVLDVALITAAVLNFPSGGVSIDWPIQTRLRNQNFLFMLLLLGEAALTYSPAARGLDGRIDRGRLVARLPVPVRASRFEAVRRHGLAAIRTKTC